jgi:hypothetical protein
MISKCCPPKNCFLAELKKIFLKNRLSIGGRNFVSLNEPINIKTDINILTKKLPLHRDFMV